MLLRSDVFSALAVMAGVGLFMQAGAPGGTLPVTELTESHAEVSFSTEVMPLMEKYCWECHSEENA